MPETSWEWAVFIGTLIMTTLCCIGICELEWYW